MRVKLKKSQIKEFIRQAIREVISEDMDDKYVSIGYGRYKLKGKEKDKDSPTFKKDDKGKYVPMGDDVGGPAYPNVPKKKSKKTKISADPFAKDDVGGPAHPNVPKKEKPTDEPEDDLAPGEESYNKIGKFMSDHKGDIPDEYAEELSQIRKDLMNAGGDEEIDDLENKAEELMNDIEKRGMAGEFDKKTMKAATDANKKMEIDVLNKQADKGDGAQIDTEYGTVTWTSGDPDEDTFFATNEDGEEIEVDYNDIVRFANDKDGSIYDNLTGGGDEEEDMDDWMSQMDKVDTAAKDAGWKDAEDVFKFGMSDDIADVIDSDDIWGSLPKDLHHPINTYLDTLRDNEQGMRDDDDDVLDNARNQLLGMVQDPENWGKKNESIKETKMRRFTVKEVRMWMKKLEENRYKKVYNSDARRVSWMVNHVGESVENMPKSMRKKWSKAQYGRERYLAKEFLKSKAEQLKEMVNEIKLRKVIRKTIISTLLSEKKNKGLWANIHAKRKRGEKPAKKGDKNYPKTLDIEEKAIHHMDMRMLYVPKKDFKNAVKLLRLNIKHGNVEVEKKPSSKVKGHYRLITTKKMFDDVVSHLAMKKIGVKTISKGKM
jgi:hypothetical protein